MKIEIPFISYARKDLKLENIIKLRGNITFEIKINHQSINHLLKYFIG